MSVGKRPALPLILSANALLGGEVVYYTAGGWTPNLGAAFVAQDGAGALKLEAVVVGSEQLGDVVGPSLVPVALDPVGRILPAHYRERIRALGPTVRPDLGPQADGENSHVSI